MKDINKLKDYRKKFKRYYGIDFSSEYAVHHIDFDRSNNDISNLMILPKGLHSRYHFCISAMRSMNDGKGPKFTVDARIQPVNRQGWYLSTLENFAEVMMECSIWGDYKLYLDGYLPNIHNITLN